MTTDPHTSARPSWMNFHTLAPVIGSLITAAAILTSAIISTRSSSGSAEATLVAVSVAASPIDSLLASTTMPPGTIAPLSTGPIQTVVRTVLVPGPSAAPQVIVITVPTDLRPLPAPTGGVPFATSPATAASSAAPVTSGVLTIAPSPTISTTGVSTTTTTTSATTSTSTTVAGTSTTWVTGANANPVAVALSTPAAAAAPGSAGATVAPASSTPIPATAGATTTTR